MNHKTGFKNFIFVVFSFLLSLLLLVTSFCSVLKLTIFNVDFIYSCMEQSNYYTDKQSEIIKTLCDLGYASGLEESFFTDFVDTKLIIVDTRAYLNDYFSGNIDAVVDDTAFQQSLNESLDEYIKENSIENVDESSKNNLIKKAAQLYKRSISITFLHSVGPYMKALNRYLLWIIGVCAVLILIIIVTFFVGNKWKHRKIKYICYGFSGAFLSSAVIPIYLMISDRISYINLTSHAVYSLFVQCAHNLTLYFAGVSVLFLIISAALLISYAHLHKR